VGLVLVEEVGKLAVVLQQAEGDGCTPGG